MKPEDLRNVYHSTDDLHNSVLSTLENLDEQAPMHYSKTKRTMKIALVCAMIAVLSTTTVVATATNLFGLLNRPVGKYGLNVTVEAETEPTTEEKHVELTLGYIPEGYVNVTQNPNWGLYYYEGDPTNDKWSFSADLYDAKDYDDTKL